MATPRRLWLDWLANRLTLAMISLARCLPYQRRVVLMGQVTQRLGKVLGMRKRAEAQIAHIFPEMTDTGRRQMANAALGNIGRVLIENYSPADQVRTAREFPVGGPGWEACEEARREGRPILFVTGHFGNYQAARAALNGRGYAVGVLFRPFNNRHFNAHYATSLEAVGGTAFPRTQPGLTQLVKSIRDGGQVQILLDQYVAEGVPLDFLGKPAPTALSAAEIALKHEALLLPMYGIRQADGMSYKIIIEAPIAPTDPLAMTQALNDSLSAQIRAAPEQWFWVHRRWKPARQARYFDDGETEPKATRRSSLPSSGAPPQE